MRVSGMEFGWARARALFAGEHALRTTFHSLHARSEQRTECCQGWGWRGTSGSGIQDQLIPRPEWNRESAAAPSNTKNPSFLLASAALERVCACFLRFSLCIHPQMPSCLLRCRICFGCIAEHPQ